MNKIFPTDSSFVLRCISLWCIFSYSLLFYKELKYAPDFHPLMILELSTIQFVGFNGLAICKDIDKGMPILFGIFDVHEYIVTGTIFLLLEHILVFTTFYIIDRHNRKNSTDYNISIYSKICNYKGNYITLAMRIYMVIIFLRIINVFYPLSNLSSILSTFVNIGQLIPLSLLTFEMIRNGNNTNAKKIHWIIVIIEIAIVLNLGMKEFILRNLIPYSIYLILSYKEGVIKFNFPFVLKISLLYIFTIYIVFPYVSIFRSLANKYNIEWSAVSTRQVVNEYIKYIQDPEDYDRHTDNSRSLDYAMSRAGSISCNSWAIHHCQENGTKPEFFYFALSSMVPRIIWPSKPKYTIGGRVSNMSHGGSFDEEDESGSVTLGFIGSCYFALGLWGALLIPLIVGIIMGIYWFYSSFKLHYSPLSLFVFYWLILILIKDLEGIQDCGVSFILFSFIFIISLIIFQSREDKL